MMAIISFVARECVICLQLVWNFMLTIVYTYVNFHQENKLTKLEIPLNMFFILDTRVLLFVQYPLSFF